MHFISLAQKKHNPKSALKKQPNIIFIVTDDQHRDQFNFLKEGQDEDGNPTNLTPNTVSYTHLTLPTIVDV